MFHADIHVQEQLLTIAKCKALPEWRSFISETGDAVRALKKLIPGDSLNPHDPHLRARRRGGGG